MTAIDVVTLGSASLQATFVVGAGMPELIAIGPAIGHFEPATFDRPIPHAGIDSTVPLGIVAEHGSGHLGRPGITGARPDGRGWAPRFALVDSDRSASAVRFELRDDVAELELTVRVEVDVVVSVSLTLRNASEEPYSVLRLAPSIPVAASAAEVVTFGGRWCREFQPDRTPFTGLNVVENRAGRTSHTHLPAMIAGTAGFNETTGEVLGVQLAWSGNYELAAERLADARRHIQAGELLAPAEVVLGPGEVYAAPVVVVAWSGAGLGPLSDAFHQHVRSNLPSSGPRKVILNTWEAVYFDHRLDVLTELADVAAQVGVERFVLDDGWFGGRRNDTAGLGDWWVSADAWPAGLGPIIDHVESLGMEFGLWVEPEMVNPDSDLYRTHPEWALTTAGYEPVLARQQLVLDLGRAEVRDYLFDALHALLVDHPIAYLKWDMNRDVIQGSHAGRAGTHGHVLGVYELIDRLRAAHPGLEIESCASGGGRVDLAILQRTDRIWTSDCNDAVERQLIQRGFSMLFPPEVMGAHVGPERAHTTGRRHDLGFRLATAFFGHLGVEWNLLRADAAQRDAVAAAIAEYRRLRPLLHGGRTVRVDHPDPAAFVHGVVSIDATRAVFAYVQLTTSATTVPALLRLTGLDSHRDYRLRLVDIPGAAHVAGRATPSWWGSDVVASGEQLTRFGLQVPILHPESAMIVECEAVA